MAGRIEAGGEQGSEIRDQETMSEGEVATYSCISRGLVLAAIPPLRAASCAALWSG
jgi:hypothetical protein